MFIPLNDRNGNKHIINTKNINDIEFKKLDESYQISDTDEYYVQINLNNEKTVKISRDEYLDELKKLINI